jgi:hypothetical protein
VAELDLWSPWGIVLVCGPVGDCVGLWTGGGFFSGTWCYMLVVLSLAVLGSDIMCLAYALNDFFWDMVLYVVEKF